MVGVRKHVNNGSFCQGGGRVTTRPPKCFGRVVHGALAGLPELLVVIHLQ